MMKFFELSVWVAGIALAGAMAACGRQTAGNVAEMEGVAVYEVVPLDYVCLEAIADGDFADVLPLRESCRPEEADRVGEFLARNDSLLAARGIAYQWVDNYSDSTRIDLVFVVNVPLLEEDVEVTEVDWVPGYGDGVQVAFRFKDKKRWERITASNIGNRIAVAVNGRILSAPQVNAPITQGGCSVIVRADDVEELLPGVRLPENRDGDG